MSLWDYCIRRPIFTAMLVTAPIVLGLASYAKLGVDLYPNVDLPVVTITTTLRGASAEEMETSVTKPIEEAINTVAGIDELRSTTKEGMSQVVIQFVLEKNGNVAAQEVESKVRTIISQLPLGTDTPIVDKFQIDASPIMTIAISGRRDFREITEIARKKIKEDLETINGIGAVTLVGGRPRAINVVLDSERLQKYENLSVDEVRLALRQENQELPGGRVDKGLSEVGLRTMGRLEKPKDFERLIVGNRNGQPIYLEDVGKVYDSFEEQRNMSRLWVNGLTPSDRVGDDAVTLIVTKQSGQNTVELVDKLKARLAELKTVLPDDIQVEIIRDQSRFIKNSMEEVQVHLILAAVLVSLTILLFMRDWRTTLIATMSIPTTMISVFAFMNYMGYTIDNVSMLAMILAIGIVIDDAVVVHENIFRHMEEYGKSAMEAASSATREIAPAVIATTLSLLVIFAPIAFMQGRVGRFFSCFGFIVGFAIMMSMLISFTMTPMLCSRFLKLSKNHTSTKGGFFWKFFENAYIALLGWSLRHRWVVVLTTFGVLMSTPMLMKIVGTEFVPRDDQSEFEVAITLPEGYTLERADDVFKEIEGRLQKLRGTTHTYTVIGDTTGRGSKGQGDVTKGTIYVRLIDLKQRKYTQFDVMRDARAITAEYPDLRCAVQDAAALSATGMRQVDIDLNLRGPNMQKLEEYSKQIMEWMKQRGTYVDIDTSLSMRKPELRLKPKRERMSDLGVSLQSVATVTNILVGGEPVTKYKEADEQYDVWLRADQKLRNDEESIARMAVSSTKAPGGVVKLGNLVDFERAQGPNTIERYSRQRQVVISANLEGLALGEGVAELGAYMKTMNLPADYRFDFLGRAKSMNETNSNFAIAFLLAFIFMYMVLAAQFESFVHPLTILAALPVTIPCAILSLILLQTKLDVFAMFGVFMLFGIVKKNGILQVDYTNQMRAKGMSVKDAIIEANRTRLRPILMTTVMLVAAMVPMAMGEGPGTAGRAGMAKVILGGQILSLLLTLWVTP
ncbi:MAG: efflux RND transporter permease subunit [Planctomycetes bacterium]|nr:efflux RND transporter permease subunit [Planctomycetota bacterium]